MGDATLVIHNAAFDVAFIDAELSRLPERNEVSEFCTVLDTLSLARRLHPGQRNSLDALCKRYEIDNSQRQLHGALLDAEILADVYLAMTGGQTMFQLSDNEGEEGSPQGGDQVKRLAPGRKALPVVEASPEELAAHQAQLDAIAASGAELLWNK